MITIEQYFFNPTKRVMKPHTIAQAALADVMLEKVNGLIDAAVEAGAYERKASPNTGCEISGSKGGSGDGGFRDETSGTGAPHSNHRKARAVDAFDPGDRLDRWLDEFEDGEGGNSMLEKHGLAREFPTATPGWCHLQDVLPNSGKRTYLP